MADPVASQSRFLTMYMNGHPDTLVLYASYFGKVAAPLESARMTAIDSQAMTLAYTTRDKKEGSVRVVFDPPLAGYEEVKPRLLAMRADADENLGLSNPTINTITLIPASIKTVPLVLACIGTVYSRPLLALLGALSALSASLSPPDFIATAHTLFHLHPAFIQLLANPVFQSAAVPVLSVLVKLGNFVGWGFVNFAYWFLIVVHALEAVYTASLCVKYKTGLVTGFYYVACTLFFGFPAWMQLRKRAQTARIDAIMKGK